VCAAALRFTKPDNRHGRGALVKESAPLLSFVRESGRKNSKEDRAKYSFRNIEDANLLTCISQNYEIFLVFLYAHYTRSVSTRTNSVFFYIKSQVMPNTYPNIILAENCMQVSYHYNKGWCSTTGKPTRLFRTKRARLDSV
jgi:hypothetical protein